MLDLFNIAKPQGCDIQIFIGTGSATNANATASWIKPRGVSHVYMMLIGGGGGGGGSSFANATGIGGGSGAVTVWYGAAQHVPDLLTIYAGRPGAQSTAGGGNGGAGGITTVNYRNGIQLVALLTANGGAGGNGNAGAPNTVAGGAAMTANKFTASGFFQSVDGVVGAAGDSIATSTTTFLSGGNAAPTSVTPNYGYPTANASTTSINGYFQLYPIPVGCGGTSNANAVGNGTVGGGGDAGIGCGGGGAMPNSSTGTDAAGGRGGAGMVLIASW